jgi:SAM-dependent methyltransferase
MRCLICDNTENNQIYHVKEMMFGLRDVFVYFQCGRCSCLQIAQVPPDMSIYYPNGYYSFRTRDEHPIVRKAANVIRRCRDSYTLSQSGMLGRLLSAVMPGDTSIVPLLRSMADTEITKYSKILDVGCGSGLLAYSLRNMGFERVMGIDTYIDADINYENGLTVAKRSLAEVGERWNLIMFHHSFEHISDPMTTLGFVSHLLTPGGICIIRIPTVSSYAWEYYRTNWVQLDAPRHFFLYSIESIRLLASKVGMAVERVVYDSTDFQFWGSEQYVRDIPLQSAHSYINSPSTSIFSVGQIRAFQRRARELNAQAQGDSAAFYLRKG